MDDDLKSASDAMTHEDKSAYRPALKQHTKKSPKKLLIIIALVIVLAVGGLALWKFVLHKPKTTPTVTDTTTQKTETTKTGEDVPDEPLSETYESKALSVGFKYPKSWKASEATGGIKIESPAFHYQAASTGSTDGLFRIYIRQGARTQDGPYIGAGVTIKPSEKLTYTEPAIGQRTDTWLSSFGSDSSDIFTFFLIAGNFQLQKGDILGPDYGKEADTYIVAGGYTVPTATDDLAMTSVALDYYATTNAYKQALAIIASLKLR
jgi:hypothetical protein